MGDIRLVGLANIIGIRSYRLTFGVNGKNVLVDGKFRYGYFGGVSGAPGDHIFWRENPVRRALYRRGIAVSGREEPQYDLIIVFDQDGDVVGLSDNRTAQTEAKGIAEEPCSNKP